jgi:hypothetical protein
MSSEFEAIIVLLLFLILILAGIFLDGPGEQG